MALKHDNNLGCPLYETSGNAMAGQLLVPSAGAPATALVAAPSLALTSSCAVNNSGGDRVSLYS